MSSGAPDLLGRTEALWAIASESRAEGPITDHLDEVLAAAPWLERTRVGDNLVARTTDRTARTVRWT